MVSSHSSLVSGRVGLLAVVIGLAAACRAAPIGIGDATAEVNDPCAFLGRYEVEAAVGYTVLPGDAQLQRYGRDCYYGADGGGSIVVMPPVEVSPAQFRRFKASLAQARTVAGIGDDAFLWASRLYVLQGDRQFSVTVTADEISDMHHYALQALGRAGVTKLRATPAGVSNERKSKF